MTRNTILVAAIVVALGLGGGLWLATKPGGEGPSGPTAGQAGDPVAPGVAAPQPVPAARPGSGEPAAQEDAEAEPEPEVAPSQAQAAGAQDTGTEEAETAEAEITEAEITEAEAETETDLADGEQAAAGQPDAEAPEPAALETAAAGTSEAAPAEEAASSADTSLDAAASAPAEEAEAVAAPASLPTPEPPSFDIVRVEKDGSTVVAGRAPPGSTVTLYDGDRPLGSTQADSNGSFALVLDEPLPPGSRVLTLSATQGDTTVASLGEVVVVVPEPQGTVQTAAAEEADASEPPAGEAAETVVAEAAPSAVPLVVATDEEGASVVLQGPGDLGGDTLRIEAVDYDLDGQVVISGRGPAGGTVALYLDDAPLGQAAVGADGRWRFTPEGAVEPGLHRLRADLLTADGQVAQRAEIPFSRAEPIQTAANEDFVVVQPGNSLWVIARGKYGQGIRYTAIYEANAGQIRDPDLIYPGQIFLIPQVN